MKYKSLYLAILLGSFSQAIPLQPVLTGQTAIKIAQTAFEQCRADGYTVSVTVVDQSGLTLAQIRDEKAGPHTLDGSYRKAFTALSMKTPTTELAKRIEENKMPQGAVNLSSNLVFMGGGLPIKSGKSIIGGIGVGGAPGGNLDEKCAQKGIDSALKDLK